MAQVQHLPLYTASYTYLRDIYRIRVKLPKLLKYDLGQEAFASALKVLKCIVVANRSTDKANPLADLLLETEVQWALIRLLFDLRGITEGEFKILSEKLSSIEKQAQAWIKWQQSKPSPRSFAHSQKKTWNPRESDLT